MLLGSTSAVLLATAGAARKKDEDHADKQKQSSHHRYPDVRDFNARAMLVLISDSDANNLILDISMRFNQEEEIRPRNESGGWSMEEWGGEAIKSEKEKMGIREVGKIKGQRKKAGESIRNR